MAGTTALSMRSHEMTTEAAAVFAPGLTPGIIMDEGILYYADSETGQSSGFDLANLKQDNRIDSPIVGKYAKKGHGKTTDNMQMAYRTWLRTMGGRRTKISIDDLRLNNGKAEYGKLCKICGVKPVQLQKFRLNLLDMALKLTFNEQLHLVKGTLQLASAVIFNAQQTKGLRYGLMKVREQFVDTAVTSDLLTCMRELNLKDVSHFESNVTSRQSHQTITPARQLLIKRQPIVSHDEDAASKAIEQLANEAYLVSLLRAAKEVADIIENLLDGEFGELFGGEHSLAEVMQQRLVVWDYNGLSEESISLVQFMLWEIKGAAIDRNDHDFFFDLEIHDENYSMWSNAIYAESMAKFMKRIRGTSTIVVLASHRLADYDAVGDENSRERKLAINMQDDISVWMIGCVSTKAAKQFQLQCGLTDEETKMLPKLPIGHWGIKIGNEPMRFVHSKPTFIENLLIASDEANDERAVPSRAS